MGVDLPQGALSAILPYLISAYHFDYATAAVLVMASNIVGSVVQPIFGQMADKRNQAWTMVVGLALAGCGISLTGLISSFPLLCGSVMIMGVGISMYHPEAALLVNRLAPGGRQGSAVSVFSFGGNLGFGVGPIIATAVLSVFDIKGTLAFLAITAAIIAAMAAIYPALKAAHFGVQKPASAAEDAKPLPQSSEEKPRDNWSGFWRLCGVIFGRSIIYAGFNTFLALYWISRFHQSNAKGGLMLSAFFIMAALSTLIGGRLADSFGHIRMIRVSCIILLPGILLLAFADNQILAFAALVPVAFAISLCYSPTVVLGQSYLAGRKGLASGVTLGLSVSIGGIVAPLLGKIGDAYGLQTTMIVIGLVAIIPLIMSFTLPKTEIR